MDAVVKGDTLGFHPSDAAVDVMLLHLEIGNAVTQQSPGLGPALEQMHVVAGARELLRAGHPRRTGAYYGDLLAGFAGRTFRLDPAIVPGAIDDGAFDG